MPQATLTETLDSDITAFKHKHTFDNHVESIVADVGDGVIIETLDTSEIFKFHADEVGDVTFDVRGIKRAIIANELYFAMHEVELVEDWVEHIRTMGGVEPDRLPSLTAADLKRPGIIVTWPHNGFSTLIDGNHRLVRRWDKGLRTFRVAIINMTKEFLPYVCKTGDEESFLEREREKRGLTKIGNAIMVV